jgi:hypothetical protein
VAPELELCGLGNGRLSTMLTNKTSIREDKGT